MARRPLGECDVCVLVVKGQDDTSVNTTHERPTYSEVQHKNQLVRRVMTKQEIRNQRIPLEIQKKN